MYKAINGDKTFDIASSGEGFVVNGNPVTWDLVRINENYFHILFENKTYRAEVIHIDNVAKTFTIKINNRPHTVQLKDKFDLLLEKMGMNNAVAGMVNSIKAPMPGLIIALKVKEGDTVKVNDPLLILEAMKMENVIKSPGDAVVKTIKVKQGENVEKNQVLIEF